MARLPFVDTHVHYWDLQDPSLRYEWLEPDWVHPILGNIDGIKVQRYMAPTTSSPRRASRTSRKAIHVQAAIGIDDPVEETRWLQEQADRDRASRTASSPTATSPQPNAQEVLERHLESREPARHPRLRPGRLPRRSGLAARLRPARATTASCSASTRPSRRWARPRALAERYPDVILCIDHAGFPRERDRRVLRAAGGGAWRRLPARRTSICKISRPRHVRPRAGRSTAGGRGCMRASRLFGVERCFFGTNWPVDRLYSSYGDVLDAYEEIIADLTRRRAGGALLGERRADLPDLEATLDGRAPSRCGSRRRRPRRSRSRARPRWAGRPSRPTCSIGVATRSCCIGLRSGLSSKSLQAGELKEIARLAALTIADDQACAFACRRCASTRSQTFLKPVIPSARPGSTPTTSHGARGQDALEALDRPLLLAVGDRAWPSSRRRSAYPSGSQAPSGSSIQSRPYSSIARTRLTASRRPS